MLPRLPLFFSISVAEAAVAVATSAAVAAVAISSAASEASVITHLSSSSSSSRGIRHQAVALVELECSELDWNDDACKHACARMHSCARKHMHARTPTWAQGGGPTECCPFVGEEVASYQGLNVHLRGELAQQLRNPAKGGGVVRGQPRAWGAGCRLSAGEGGRSE